MPVFANIGSVKTKKMQQQELLNNRSDEIISPKDPRPDLEADSALWSKLLRRSQKLDPMLAGTLHGFRCGGLRIKRGRTGYLLRPDFDLTGNLATWKDQDEYEYDKLLYLFQYRAEIKELMTNL